MFSHRNSVFSQKNLHVGIHEARHTKNWRIWSFSIFASLWWYLLLLLAPHSVLFMGPHTKQKSIDSNMVVFPFHRTFSSHNHISSVPISFGKKSHKNFFPKFFWFTTEPAETSYFGLSTLHFGVIDVEYIAYFLMWNC